jgi:hypothetical protein
MSWSPSVIRVLVSAVGELFQSFRVAVTLNRDGRDGALDFTQIVANQLDLLPPRGGATTMNIRSESP